MKYRQWSWEYEHPYVGQEYPRYTILIKGADDELRMAVAKLVGESSIPRNDGEVLREIVEALKRHGMAR